MQRNGFIATSLIYSFFLVFVAIMAALLSSFIANKTILTRFNEEAMSNLNTEEYSVAFTIYGAEASTSTQRGQTLTNRIRNGNFLNTEGWQQNGELSFTSTTWSKPAAQLSGIEPNSYIYQNVLIEKDKQYYMSLEYATDSTMPIKSFLDPAFPIVTDNTDGTWLKKSRLYEQSVEDSWTPFMVGYNDLGVVYDHILFTNIMLINLTDHFGTGKEPSLEWMDENIDYFEGTIQYLKEEKVNSTLELTMTPRQEDYNSMSVVCVGANGKWIDREEVKEKSYMNVDGKQVGILSLKDINDDLSCTVRWTHE